MISKSIALCILLLGSSMAALAVDVPLASSDDPRIRHILYKPNDVTLIKVRRGVVTRITLADDERIEVPVTGLSSGCDRVDDEWCISAVKGTNQIFVRPRDNAVRNNMELHTNKRDYSFDFQVLPDSSPAFPVGNAKNSSIPAFFRVIFNYPPPPAPSRQVAVDDILRRIDAPMKSAGVVSPDFGMTPTQRLKAEGVDVRNSNYSKQVLGNGADAEPSLVFDDGRFTYFEFLGAREIPAIFASGSDGEPTRVNWHMQGSFVVVQRTARTFTLRLGGAVVGIFNEAFDSIGVDTPTSTISSAVVREIKDASQ